MISVADEFIDEQLQIELIIILTKLGLNCSNIEALLKMSGI